MDELTKNVLLWTNRVFRIIVWTLCATLLLCLIFCGAAYVKYRFVLRDTPAVEVLQTPSADLPDGKATLGSAFTISARFRVPWNRTPGSAVPELGEGLQMTGEPRFIFDHYGWGANEWRLILNLQTYRDGSLKTGRLNVTFTGQGAPECLSFDLPDITSVLPSLAPAETELAVAGEVPPDAVGKRSVVLKIFFAVLGLLILVLVILVLLRFFRKRQEFSLKAYWLVAIETVQQLRENVRRGSISPERSITELTYIVRHYIEKRFSLRADHLTTSEFLREMDKDESPLASNDRRFLQKFLSAADMVKYARISSDAEAFESVAVRAEKLIEETSPDAASPAGKEAKK